MSTPSRRGLHSDPADSGADQQAHVRTGDGEGSILRVAIDNDYPLVVMGLTAVLAERTRSCGWCPSTAQTLTLTSSSRTPSR